MEELHNLSLTTGTSIPEILQPTLQILAPHLQKNRHSILSTPRSTHQYGTHPRQTLDFYPSTRSPSSSPILIYIYGGGLTRGDKNLGIPLLENLVYANLGSYFSAQGISTLIPDYRRVDSESGGEGAVYPSGAEDLACVLQWLAQTHVLDGMGNRRDVYLMGNSAGGVHIATYLLEPRFLEERKMWQIQGQGEGKGDGDANMILRGVVEVGVPFHFHEALSGRKEMLARYYGNSEEVQTKCPYGLLKAIGETQKSREELGIPKLLVMNSEWDPVDEILNPNDEFVRLGEEVWGEKIEVRMIKGHNHISPPMALGSGVGEEWGEQVAGWIKGNV
ncbi:hypothetical protein NHQ30_003436 [Ciborinia camelliae]|nr:hypothetical protein NHQ30_003436 [Ciborinia camelliae]